MISRTRGTYECEGGVVREPVQQARKAIPAAISIDRIIEDQPETEYSDQDSDDAEESVRKKSKSNRSPHNVPMRTPVTSGLYISWERDVEYQV